MPARQWDALRKTHQSPAEVLCNDNHKTQLLKQLQQLPAAPGTQGPETLKHHGLEILVMIKAMITSAT